MKPEGFRCPGSRVGFPHGKDKKAARREAVREREAEKAAKSPVVAKAKK